MQLVKKIKDTRKSVPILINSCISCNGSRDLICIFYDKQIDKKKLCACLTKFNAQLSGSK